MELSQLCSFNVSLLQAKKNQSATKLKPYTNIHPTPSLTPSLSSTNYLQNLPPPPALLITNKDLPLGPPKKKFIIKIPLIITLIHALASSRRTNMRTMFHWIHQCKDNVDTAANNVVAPYFVEITECFVREGCDALVCTAPH